ncbi:MAG: hypothetical protein J6R47_01370 [Acholeplasmatales bacterium]|nr:hypothetical protein [Acholeplasmatales bacterium]
MNKVVKQQLGKCRIAKIPPFDDNTTHIFIPRLNKGGIVLDFQLNHYYVIEIADYVLNPSPEFTLATNWNKGTLPPSKYMKIQVSQINGKMIKITGIAYDIALNKDLPKVWEGWLPASSARIINNL